MFEIDISINIIIYYDVHRIRIRKMSNAGGFNVVEI